MPPYKLAPIKVNPGIQYESGTGIGGENSGFNNYWTASNRIRFVDGWPEAIEGTTNQTYTTTNPLAVSAIGGVCRGKIYFYSDGTNDWAIYGTTTGLFAVGGGEIYNITPLSTSNTAIANSLATQFDSLANDPVATLSNGSPLVQISHTSHGLRVGDTVSIGGVSGTIGGIAAASINGTRTITSTGFTSNSYVVTAAANASSVASGGGASVTVGTGAITVTHASHGFSADQRVKLSGAADTGGILAANINKEFSIRTIVNANSYKVVGTAMATSAVSGGGGASVVEFIQVPTTTFDDTGGTTIWSFDKATNTLIACPGARRKVYEWSGNTAVAATAVSNAPTDVDIIFMMNGKLVALTGNRIRNSNAGDRTDWTLATGSQAYDDVKDEAKPFIGYAIQGNRVVLGSEDSFSALDDVGGDDVWAFSNISRNYGLDAQNLIMEAGGIIYFVGGHNFNRINGSIIEHVPGNTMETLFRDAVGYNATEFMAFNPFYNEIWIHYGSSGSNTTGYIIYHLDERVFCNGSLTRSAAAYDVENERMMMIKADGTVSRMLTGSYTGLIDGAAMGAYVETNYASIGQGDNLLALHGMEMGGVGSGNIDVTVSVKNNLAQFADVATIGPVTIDMSGSSGRLYYGPVVGRYRKVKFALSSGTTFMRLSGWKDLIAASGAKY